MKHNKGTSGLDSLELLAPKPEDWPQGNRARGQNVGRSLRHLETSFRCSLSPTRSLGTVRSGKASRAYGLRPVRL